MSRIFKKAIKNRTILTAASILLALTLSIIVACAGIIEINKRYIHFSVVALGSSKAGRIVLLGVWVLTVVIVIYDYPRIVEFANIWDDYLLPGVD